MHRAEEFKILKEKKPQIDSYFLSQIDTHTYTSTHTHYFIYVYLGVCIPQTSIILTKKNSKCGAGCENRTRYNIHTNTHTRTRVLYQAIYRENRNGTEQV